MIDSVEILHPKANNVADVIARLPVCVGSKRHYELQREDYIELVYSSEEPLGAKVGDLCYLLGYGTFCVTEKLFPNYNSSTGGYDYTIKLEADYRLWKNHIFKLTYGGVRTESEWKLTDTLEGHAKELLRNIVALGFKHINGVLLLSDPDKRTISSTNWNPDSDLVIADEVAGKGAKLIEYSNTDLLSALDKIADTFDCEWWYSESDKKLHFGTAIEPALDEQENDVEPLKLVHESATTEAGADANVENMTRNASQGNYANRLQVLGGTRNMPETYRKEFILYPTEIDDYTYNNEDYWKISDAIRPLYTNFFFDSSDNPISIDIQKPALFLNNNSHTATIVSIGNAYHAEFFCVIDFGSTIEVGSDQIPKVIFNNVRFEYSRSIRCNLQIRASLIDAQHIPAADPGASGGYSLTFNNEFSDEIAVSDIVAGQRGSHLYMRLDIFIPLDRVDTSTDVLETTMYGQTTLELSYSSEQVFTARTLTLTDIQEHEDVETSFSIVGKTVGKKQETAILIPKSEVSSLDDTNPARYCISFDDNAINQPIIPSAYYSGDPATNASRGIAERRLQIPVGSGTCETSTPDHTQYYYNNGYIQALSVLPEREVIEASEVIDDEFPREDAGENDYYQVGDLTERMESSTETFSDGSQIVKEFPVYRFKNSNSNVVFDDDWRAEGSELQVTFQSGLLAGMTFKVEFNPDGKTKMLIDNGNYVYNPDAQVFEIVINETYGRALPDDILKPANDDYYLLTGFSPKAMGNMGIVDAAEERLLTKGADALQRRLLDGSTYQAEMITDSVIEYYTFITYDDDVFVTDDDEIFCTADISNSDNLPPLGRRVSLYHKAYGLSGTQNRVIGYEFPLDMPFDHPKLIIGMTPQKKRLRAIEKAINKI